jgi:glucosamine--fructose-6-phosphate aminotransferase (isomerizing)
MYQGAKGMSDFEKELYEQPDVITRLVAEESARAQLLAADMRRRGVQYVMVAGRGTSDNAGVYGKYLFAAMNRLPVAMATPSLFSLYDTPPRFGDAVVLGISQSGQSPDIVSVLAEARRQGALTAAFTNEPDSPLAEQADHILALHAGEERSVAATKTYTAQLAAVALINVALKGEPGLLSALKAAPDAMRQALDLAPEVRRIAERYRFIDRLVVLGRGFNLATAQEIALKLKETNYIAAEPYSPADFIHGPTAMVDENCPVVVIAPSGVLLAELREAIAQVAQRGGEILVISDDSETLTRGRMGLALPAGVPEWLSPLVAVLPGQLLALHMVLERGRDPDRPRGLQKVTLTR